MKNKSVKKVVILAACLILVSACWLAFCGYKWSWGPFSRLHDVKMRNLQGNAEAYSPQNVEPIDNPLLKDRRIICLGSSVTYGASSLGVSFADYLEARDGCQIIKDAVSGTTLTDEGINSYISRLKKLDTDLSPDLFLCQLSTNDATQGKTLGAVTDGKEIEEFDTKTVAGAIEYIIAYVKQTWDCPVMFYTNPRYDSENYGEMVDILKEIAEKWDVTVINLWDSQSFNSISEEQRDLYMADDIHPTQAGYLEWWLPEFERSIGQVFQAKEQY